MTGVFPRMNEVYLFCSEMRGMLQVIRSLLGAGASVRTRCSQQ